VPSRRWSRARFSKPYIFAPFSGILSNLSSHGPPALGPLVTGVSTRVRGSYGLRRLF